MVAFTLLIKNSADNSLTSEWELVLAPAFKEFQSEEKGTRQTDGGRSGHSSSVFPDAGVAAGDGPAAVTAAEAEGKFHN